MIVCELESLISFLLDYSRISLKTMKFRFLFCKTKKFHPNTLKSVENFKTSKLIIFSIIVNFKVFYEKSGLLTVNFK